MRKLSKPLRKVPISTVVGFVSAITVAFLSAQWGARHAISEERELHRQYAADLVEVIRFEAIQNLNTLTKSTVNLRAIESDLEAFVAGDAPAPPIGPGYLGLATVGLRLQLEGPSAYYVPHGLVMVYGLVYGRLARFEKLQQALDDASIEYAVALTSAEQRRAAADLLIRIRHQLHISDALVDPNGLPTFLQCLDQFSAGAEVCEYTLLNALRNG